MRVHQRNAVLSYDGSGPILRDTVKSGISKSGVSTELPSYGHGDLRGGHAGFRKAESPPHVVAHSYPTRKVYKNRFAYEPHFGIHFMSP